MPATRGEGAEAGAIEKVATRVQGLDEILHGGIPAGRLTLITGGPGTGKTILGVEILYRAALEGAPGVLVAFEETADAVRANARALGFDLAALERSQKLIVAAPELPQGFTTAGDFDIQGLLAGLSARIDAIQARCIVIDALDVILRRFENGGREHEEIERLHRWLRARRVTAVLTLKVPKSDDRLYPYLDFMADCVLHLDQRIADQIRTRRLAVIKYRGSGFMGNEAPFAITPAGIRILPVPGIVKPRRQTAKERIGSGSRQLDQILGGGFRPGESILLAGAAGTGKTTLAAAFTDAACRAGQRVLLVNYEISTQVLVDSMRSPGIHLDPHLAAGDLSVIDAMPEVAGVEEHLVQVLDAAAAFQPDHLIIDAVSALRRMGAERAGFEMLVRLFSYCGNHGITLLLLNQTPAGLPFQDLSGFGVSSLVDTIICLQFAENEGRLRTRLLVVKSRGTAHARDYQELRIGNHGIEIVPDQPRPAPVDHQGTEVPQ
jgi:circadian clock protein KaiC